MLIQQLVQSPVLRHVGGGDEVRLAELRRCRLIGRDRKIKKHRALLVWSLTASRLPFAASALGKFRDSAVGAARPLLGEQEMSLACPSTAAAAAPVAVGMLSNRKTR